MAEGDPELESIRETPERRLVDWLFQPASFRFTRFFILRLLGLVYLVAFVVAWTQLTPLVGNRGLEPAGPYLDWIAHSAGGRFAGFLRAPSLFWLTGTSDAALHAVSAVGIVLSLAVLLGATNALLQLALWALYMSIVHVGQTFYGYGWEIQLLETGFLAIFLCPVTTVRPLPARGPPVAIVWLFRWLIVRVMLGAGLIKLRGDPCWRELTCLVYHYETQPNPSPMGWLLHQAPPWFQHVGVAFNHLVELVVPFFVFSRARARHVAGGLLVAFQVILIVSGNLSFLNWLTIVPAIACFDDGVLGRLLPRRLREGASEGPSPSHRVTSYVVAFFVAVLSINPVTNLLSSEQVMNTSYDRLHLVGTYGAFGSINRARLEVVLEGTSDDEITDATVWREYQFPCKPGDVNRRPCMITPYHYRLDWQLWFAGFESYEEQPWIVHLVYMFLRGDRSVEPLLAYDPFPDKPPQWVRIQRYQYRMTRLGDGTGAWWTRELLGDYLGPVKVDAPELVRFVNAYGWQ